MFKFILSVLICGILSFIGGIISAWANDVYGNKKSFLITVIIYTFIGLLEANLFFN